MQASSATSKPRRLGSVAQSPLRSSLLLRWLLLGSVCACGAEAPLATDLDSPEDEAAEAPSQPEPSDVAANDVSPALEATLEREALAPGYVAAAYPSGPYGYGIGAVVPNLQFLGWPSPVDAGYDQARVEGLDFARFYDPDGEKGIELLFINASAVWCGVCQQEFRDLREAAWYDQVRPRGVEMLGVLFEDADSLPARYSDLETWARAFEVRFPLVLDPGFKMGAFFDRSATPMNMVVDARTMTVLISMTGYNPELYDWIERELVARGR